MAFQIIRNDITKVKADAIVDTANPNPVVGSGTDLAIYEAAGYEKLLKEREMIGVIARGDARVTKAFGLKAKYIIHTVGPIWEDGAHGELETLKSCYANSLELAVTLKCRSIAFPLIATGVYGFPKDKALQIALSTIQAFLLEHDMLVTLVVFDKKAFELSGQLVENVREYVDANYLEEAREREYGDSVYTTRTSRRRIVWENDAEECVEEAIEMNMAPQASMAPQPLMDLPVESPKASKPKETFLKSMDAQRSKGIILEPQEQTFQEKLFEIIDERGLPGPQVYKGYISKQVYSKIQSDRNYHPNKFTAVALCLSLHLNLDDTQDLIGRAGFNLSRSSKADLVVRSCIMQKEYNLMNINTILFDMDLPQMDKIK